MKKITMFLTIGATVAMLALPVAADYCAGYSTGHCQHRSECPPEQRDALYKTFTENRTADQAKAFEAAKNIWLVRLRHPLKVRPRSSST